MNSLQQTAIELIRRLPDSCSADDIMAEVDFAAHVLEGLRDSEAGRTVSSSELLDRVASWRK